MQRTKWTPEEIEIVLTAAAPLYFNDRLTYAQAFARAQEHLPLERRRKLHSQGLAELSKQLRMRMQVPIAKSKQLQKEMSPSEPLRDPQSVELMVTPIEQAPAGSVDIQSTGVHLPIEQALQRLITAIVGHIVDEINVQVPKALQELEHSFKLPRHNAEYAANGKHKPRIMIVGLLQQQGKMIAQEFANTFDIHHVDTDKALSACPIDASAFLLMRNFISHAVFDKYQQFPNHVLIDGGMTAVRTWLHSKGKELV